MIRYTSAAITIFILSAGLFLFSWDGSIFPHKPHIAGGIDCEQCHVKIRESVSSRKGAEIPDKKSCNECHDEKEAYAERVKYRYRHDYKFNHKLHVTGQGVDCKDCHIALFEKEAPMREEIIPKMEYCFQCHDNVAASQYCMLCHENPTRPKDHYKRWDKLHGKKASTDKKECLACHASRNDCLRCHRGDKAVHRYHNPNYEISHRYESRLSLKHCRSCHSERQCRDCHRSSGVAYTYPPLRQRHPAGWANRASSSFHGRKARRNIASCTTCHAKNECNYCHVWIKRR